MSALLKSMFLLLSKNGFVPGMHFVLDSVLPPPPTETERITGLSL